MGMGRGLLMLRGLDYAEEHRPSPSYQHNKSIFRIWQVVFSPAKGGKLLIEILI